MGNICKLKEKTQKLKPEIWKSIKDKIYNGKPIFMTQEETTKLLEYYKSANERFDTKPRIILDPDEGVLHIDSVEFSNSPKGIPFIDYPISYRMEVHNIEVLTGKIRIAHKYFWMKDYLLYRLAATEEVMEARKQYLIDVYKESNKITDIICSYDSYKVDIFENDDGYYMKSDC